MRNLVLAGVCCAASANAAYASTIGTPEIVLTFEDVDEGLLISFEASINLAGLNAGGFGEPFNSRLWISPFFAFEFTSASSTESIDEFLGHGNYIIPIFILGDELFDSTNVINETGDNFGFGIRGTDVPRLTYRLPSGYVSNTPLAGSATFVDMALADVSTLLGTFALDHDRTRFVTFRASADLDSDSDVDGSDFLALQRSNPALISTWESQFGVRAPERAIPLAVPEPSACTLVAITSSVVLTRRRR